MTDRAIYQAPWREQLADGQLSECYGPSSPAAYAKAVKRFYDWAYRPAARGVDDYEEVMGWMRPGGHLRDDVPEGERWVYVGVYERHQSMGQLAKERHISRSTVKSYLRRLRARVRESSR